MPIATKTYTFTPGTTAAAAQVNQNFDDLLNFLNVTKLGADNIQNNAITNALMADNAIGNAEMMDNAVGANELIDAAVTSRKWKPTVDVVHTGEIDQDITSTSYANVTSALISITPPVASKLMVVTTLSLYVARVGGSIEADLRMCHSVDGVDDTANEKTFEIQMGRSTLTNNGVYRGDLTLMANISLIAAAHTIRARARAIGGGVDTEDVTIESASMAYFLVAA